MKVTIRQVNGLSLMGKADSSHCVPMDTVEEFEGLNAGTKPLELVQLGLDGCIAMDVLSILRKKSSPIQDFEMEIDT